MKDKEEILDAVKAYAEQAHGTQTRKFTAERYINHPIRVMEMVSAFDPSLSVLSAALLHDVLEDTDIDENQMKEFLEAITDVKTADDIRQLVIELTDIYTKANYPSLNRRTRRTQEAVRLSKVSSQAQTIKYADIIDNVQDIVNQETDFALVYMRECKQLLIRLDQGNSVLRQRAVELVDHSLQEYYQRSNIKSL